MHITIAPLNPKLAKQVESAVAAPDKPFALLATRMDMLPGQTAGSLNLGNAGTLVFPDWTKVFGKKADVKRDEKAEDATEIASNLKAFNQALAGPKRTALLGSALGMSDVYSKSVLAFAGTTESFEKLIDPKATNQQFAKGVTGTLKGGTDIAIQMFGKGPVLSTAKTTVSLLDLGASGWGLANTFSDPKSDGWAIAGAAAKVGLSGATLAAQYFGYPQTYQALSTFGGVVKLVDEAGKSGLFVVSVSPSPGEDPKALWRHLANPKI